MFESLKKKFSRTSEKLEEELIEEAEAEDNLKEESGSRFSFFSFGRKKKEESEEDDDNLLPQAEESVEDAPIAEEETEEAEEEKKSHFWSGNKEDGEEDSEDETPEEVEEVKEEKKSHFWSRNKDDDEEEDSQDDEEEEAPEEEKKSHFWNRNKDKEDVSADGEASGGIFSFVREKTIQEKHVEDILFELEMELLQGDVAMEVATDVVESVKDNLVGKKIKRSNDITEYTYFALKDAVYDIINIHI